MQFHLALNKTFCPTPPPLTHRQLRHHQRTKINKTRLSRSISSVFEFGPSLSESSTRILKLDISTDSEHKFHNIPIHKVLEYSWRHFTSLELCKCSQIPRPSPRVASTPNRTKTNHHWLNHQQTLQTH